MKIVDARIKVSFTKEENRALRTARDILKKLEVKNSISFLNAYLDKDWAYSDDDTTFEFLDNQYDEEQEEEE